MVKYLQTENDCFICGVFRNDEEVPTIAFIEQNLREGLQASRQ